MRGRVNGGGGQGQVGRTHARPHTGESLLAALAEAVHDHDERTLRRLLARFAEQATLADLPALSSALGAGQRGRGRGRPRRSR
ncbi:hypothetical protein GCM10020229_72080 [Kitasatospora albolonga]